jgi:hypothetical protein
MIACRNEPSPELPRFVTVNVDISRRSSKISRTRSLDFARADEDRISERRVFIGMALVAGFYRTTIIQVLPG